MCLRRREDHDAAGVFAAVKGVEGLVHVFKPILLRDDLGEQWPTADGSRKRRATDRSGWPSAAQLPELLLAELPRRVRLLGIAASSAPGKQAQSQERQAAGQGYGERCAAGLRHRWR